LLRLTFTWLYKQNAVVGRANKIVLCYMFFYEICLDWTLRAIFLFAMGKIAEKAVRRSVFLTTYMALFFECRINKYALLQTVFSAILPIGLCFCTYDQVEPLHSYFFG